MFGTLEKDNDVTLDVCQTAEEQFWKVLGIVQSSSSNDVHLPKSHGDGSDLWIQDMVKGAIDSIQRQK